MNGISEEDLKTAIDCIRIHRGGVAMMKSQRFHMAVVNENEKIIGTVKRNGDGVSMFYHV